MRDRCLIAVVLVVVSVSASADSIPTYNLTQGTIFVSPAPDPQQVLVDYSFGGPGGVAFAGTSTNTNSCFFVVAGDACFPGGVTYPFENTDTSFAVVGGTFYAPLYSIGGVGFGGAPITPTSAHPIQYLQPPCLSCLPALSELALQILRPVPAPMYPPCLT